MLFINLFALSFPFFFSSVFSIVPLFFLFFSLSSFPCLLPRYCFLFLSFDYFIYYVPLPFSYFIFVSVVALILFSLPFSLFSYLSCQFSPYFFSFTFINFLSILHLLFLSFAFLFFLLSFWRHLFLFIFKLSLFCLFLLLSICFLPSTLFPTFLFSLIACSPFYCVLLLLTAPSSLSSSLTSCD